MPRRTLKDHPTAQAVYTYIKTYRAEHDGQMPTVRDIGRACHLAVSSVHHHLENLETWGLIRRERRIARAIQIVDEDAE
ncbi:MAG: MarR family transcriptional regulator [bacterium]|nr:MarR family transcriptional regulator [bacterium]